MRITSHILDAFLKCATKCHLRSLGEIGSGNEYAEWVRGQDESYQREAARGLRETVPETQWAVAPPATENLKAAEWRLHDKREKYHHSLKALAIREAKTHIVGSPELKIEGTPVYLNVEGLPDSDFYYLIGMRLGHGESAIQHSL